MALAVVVPALLVGACGGAQPTVDDELTAQPYPREAERPAQEDLTPTLESWEPSADVDVDVGGDEGSDPAPPAVEDDAEETAQPDEVGPRPSDAATYVAERLPGDARDHDVLLVEHPVGEPKLVLALVTAERQALVETARWSGEAFEHVDRAEGGPAEALGTLRTPSLAEERLIGLGLHHEGELRIGVWRLEGGTLQVPDECPLDEPRGIHGQRSSPVEVTCDEAAGSPKALVWHDGVFEPRGETARTGRPDRADDADRAKAADRAAPGHDGRSEEANGRSDAGDGPRGTQGRGPRGR